MILPLSCHGTFPRALALIEWKLNLLTFFSACYSLVPLFINSAQIQISKIFKKKIWGCLFIDISAEIFISGWMYYVFIGDWLQCLLWERFFALSINWFSFFFFFFLILFMFPFLDFKRLSSTVMWEISYLLTLYEGHLKI